MLLGIYPHISYKIDILTDIPIEFGHSIQYNSTNDITIESFKMITYLHVNRFWAKLIHTTDRY